MIEFHKKNQKIIIKEKIIWQHGNFFILENKKNEKKFFSVSIPLHPNYKIDFYKLNNNQVFLHRSLVIGGPKMDFLYDYNSNIFEHDNVGSILIYDENMDKYERIPCGFTEFFSSYKVEFDNLNERRFFLLKDSHKKKQKLILFNENFTDFYEITDFINLKDIFVINDKKNNKIILADKDTILKEFHSGKKSVEKIELENISKKINKKVEAITFNIFEERKSFYEMDSKRENKIKTPKKVMLIPFYDGYIYLNYYEAKEPSEIKGYYSINLKKVYVESCNENEIILQVITQITHRNDKKTQIFYVIDRQSYSYSNGKIIDNKSYYVVIAKGKEIDKKVEEDSNKMIYTNLEKHIFQERTKPLYETIKFVQSTYCEYHSIKIFTEGVLKEISIEEYENFINKLKI